MDPSVKSFWSDSSSTWGRVPVRTCPLGGTREGQSSRRRHTFCLLRPPSPPPRPPPRPPLSLSLPESAGIKPTRTLKCRQMREQPAHWGRSCSTLEMTLARTAAHQVSWRKCLKVMFYVFFFFLFLLSCREVTWRRCRGTTCANMVRLIINTHHAHCAFSLLPCSQMQPKVFYLLLPGVFFCFFVCFNIRLQTNWGRRAFLSWSLFGILWWRRNFFRVQHVLTRRVEAHTPSPGALSLTVEVFRWNVWFTADTISKLSYREKL